MVRPVFSPFQAVSRHRWISSGCPGHGRFPSVHATPRTTMGLYRILVLCAMFFLVGLSSNLHMAVAVVFLGLLVYAALWVYEISTRRNRK
jgi:hypothetical protein